MRIITSIVLSLIAFQFSIIGNAFAQTTQEILSVNLHYSNPNVQITSIEKKTGFLTDVNTQPETGYTLQILNYDSKELYKIKFEFPIQVISDDFSNTENSESKIEDQVKYSLNVPVFENAQKIVILDQQGNTAAQKNIAVLINPNQDQKVTPEQQSNLLDKFIPFTIGIVCFIVLVIIGIYAYRNRKNQNNLNGRAQDPNQEQK